MKRIILILMAVVLLVSCHKEPRTVGVFNPEKKIASIHRYSPDHSVDLTENWHWVDGKLMKIDAGDSTMTFTYDSLDRIASIIIHAKSEHHTIKCVYDGNKMIRQECEIHIYQQDTLARSYTYTNTLLYDGEEWVGMCQERAYGLREDITYPFEGENINGWLNDLHYNELHQIIRLTSSPSDKLSPYRGLVYLINSGDEPLYGRNFWATRKMTIDGENVVESQFTFSGDGDYPRHVVERNGQGDTLFIYDYKYLDD